ncbi:GntR family transcriptional regulator, partial [Streptomyces sp. NPDC002130]|uniref:GntR family transcriptional regulator n=1 Tax=Streptomyces sp. NPDC002130 TaxID=3155568 RepID=UPI00332F9C5C
MSTGMNTAPEPLREVVYRELRTELVNGTIGFDQRLTEPKLSTRFGISRTPVDRLVRYAEFHAAVGEADGHRDGKRLAHGFPFSHRISPTGLSCTA